MGHKSKKKLAEEELKRKKKLSDNPKQLRARARRAREMQSDALGKLYKPLEEWDDEELARGRPRAKDGTFKGATPSYIDRAVHEEIVRRFQEVIRTGMNVHTVDALKQIGDLLSNEDVDDKGRPIVPAGTKLDAAKFLIEHVVGKPTQRTEVDISVKLQAILATASVTVDEGEFVPGLPGSVIEADSWEEEDEDDD